MSQKTPRTPYLTGTKAQISSKNIDIDAFERSDAKIRGLSVVLMKKLDFATLTCHAHSFRDFDSTLKILRPLQAPKICKNLISIHTISVVVRYFEVYGRGV